MSNSKFKLVSTTLHWGFGIFAAVVLMLLITAQLSLRELPTLYPIIFTIGIGNAILHGYEFAQWLSRRSV